MAKFVFRLQPLLDLKTQLENNTKNELGSAMGKLEQEKDVLRKLETSEDECIDHFNSQSSKGTLVNNLIAYKDYILDLREKIELQKENVNYAQIVVDTIRDRFIKIMKERKILDKLREKKYKDFLKEQLKNEQRLNDEIVSFKRSSNNTGEEYG